MFALHRDRWKGFRNFAYPFLESTESTAWKKRGFSCWRPEAQSPTFPLPKSKIQIPANFSSWFWVLALGPSAAVYLLFNTVENKRSWASICWGGFFSTTSNGSESPHKMYVMFFQFSARWSEAPYRIKTLKRHRFFVYHLWSSCDLLPFFLHKIGSSGLVDMPVCTEMSK